MITGIELDCFDACYIFVQDSCPTYEHHNVRLYNGEDGFEDLCHLWVKRACRHAEWEGELI